MCDRSLIRPQDVGEAALTALANVAWNAALAEALTPTLHAVELSLRNWMDRAISTQLASQGFAHPNNWLQFDHSWMHLDDQELIDRARKKTSGRAGSGHNDLVATTSFALWTNMIDNSVVWGAMTSYQAGKLTKDYDRKTLHKQFDDIRNLRNRAYHLEPIFCQKDLSDVYGLSLLLLQRLSLRWLELTGMLDRFPDVFDHGNGWEAFKVSLFDYYQLAKIPDG